MDNKKQLLDKSGTDEAMEQEFENEERKMKKTTDTELWKEINTEVKAEKPTAHDSGSFNEDTTRGLEEKINKKFPVILQSDTVPKNIKSNDAINPNIDKILPFNQGAEGNQIVKKNRRSRFHEQKAVIDEWAVFVNKVLKDQEFEAQGQQKLETERETSIKYRTKLEKEAMNREDEKHIQLVKCVEQDYQREQMELDNLDSVAATIAAEQIDIEEVLEQIDTIKQKKEMLYKNYNKRKLVSKKRMEARAAHLSPIPENSLKTSLPVLKTDKYVPVDNNKITNSTGKNIHEPIYYIQQYESGKTVLIDMSTLQIDTKEKNSSIQKVKKISESDATQTKTDMSDNIASKTRDTHSLNSQNDNKVKSGNEVNENLHKSKENTSYLIPSSDNILNKTLVIDNPKCENGNVRKLVEIKTTKNIPSTQINKTENKSYNTQTMKYLPDKTLNATIYSLNNNTTETKPDDNMQQKEMDQSALKNDTEENKYNDNTKKKNKSRNRRKHNK